MDSTEKEIENTKTMEAIERLASITRRSIHYITQCVESIASRDLNMKKLSKLKLKKLNLEDPII